MIRIIPAILEQDINEVQKKLDALVGVSSLAQIDIADGKFVESTTIELEELQQVNTKLDLEIHLMVERPHEYLALCQKLNAYRVFWHYEADSDLDGTLSFARQFSFKKGVVLNPPTPVSAIAKTCGCFDAVLLMGVVPGAQGRPFAPQTIERVKELRAIFNGPIAVDGAVSEHNIKALARAGAVDLAVGSALFKSEAIENRYRELSALANE